MNMTQTVNRVKSEIENIENHTNDLKIIDWDEIFSYVPDSDGLKEEILLSIKRIGWSVESLKKTL